MAKPKNAYLAKLEQRQNDMTTKAYEWSLQLVFDALTLVLNDPSVMGKDVFGEQRLKKLSVGSEQKGEGDPARIVREGQRKLRPGAG